ncbi:dTDP-4-amino-4,6-dideoxygalactose transaminase [Nocardioides terrae]|uniref:dTDP-4-amino-4,6-dideoxygalactose transaminase n=1 Tax=Nocardioides terrae TaxID=574651 RepID=UPI001FE183C6|nr:dTDP-4-amino-4,6-dideoxygalactose transaminase [Nocardioides terrae]
MSARGVVPFTTPWVAPAEELYVLEALRSGLTSGDGPFTRRATRLVEALVGGGRALLTTSCTHALEMTALLLDIKPGDEVILPSFTFVSTANAFVLRGATPVFVDIREDTFNLDERLLEAAITPRTRAIVVVHYGGVACAMDEIGAIAQRHGITVVEDNAHGLGGAYRGRPLGSLAPLATQSFHATKNVSCGEGGALVLNDESLVDRAEILREKGTNRSQFYRGMVDKYRWMDVGSSYLPSDVLAAMLTAQLESFNTIQERRGQIWDTYHKQLAGWAAANGVRLPVVPDECDHPAHVYALLAPTHDDRTRFIEALSRHGIVAPFHYVPLHESPVGEQVGRTAAGGCPVTTDVSSRLLRLPLFASLSDADLEYVIDAVVTLTAA